MRGTTGQLVHLIHQGYPESPIDYKRPHASEVLVQKSQILTCPL